MTIIAWILVVCGVFQVAQGVVFAFVAVKWWPIAQADLRPWPCLLRGFLLVGVALILFHLAGKL